MREVTLRQEKAKHADFDSETLGHWKRESSSKVMLSVCYWFCFFMLSAVEKAGRGEVSLGKNRKRSLLKLGNVRSRPALLWKI